MTLASTVFRWTLIALWMLVPTALATAETTPASTPPSYHARLVTDLLEPAPQNRFDCSERVFIYITWYKVYGPHQVTALWINPQGGIENRAELEFVGEDDETDCWLALEFLNVTPDGQTNRHSPAARRFTGAWRVTLQLDGKNLETKEFQVNCG